MLVGITLIRGPGGLYFQMKNMNFQRAAHKTEGQAGGLHKKVVWRAAEKGSPPALPFPQPSLMCSPPACLNVQPTGSPFCAARQPMENSCFSFGNTALQTAQPSV